MGSATGPASFPDVNRITEAVVRQLCAIHPTDTRVGGETKSRWALVLASYARIRQCVGSDRSVMEGTMNQEGGSGFQLPSINQKVLSKWYVCFVMSHLTVSHYRPFKFHI